MTAQAPHNDSPISEPSEDRFGIEPFAKTLASGILKMTAPDGTVIALNGPWGSGKSSAVNLVLHHLADAVEAEEISIVNFACWWFRGEEALALAFFRELYAGLGPSLGSRFKKALPKLGARLLKTAGIVGPAIDMAGGAGAGTIASSAMNWASGFIKQEDTVEKLYAQISKALSDQDRRFLIVIDDIDRLAPDEALLIFRLIKSVGRLPNVIYLLVFDRALADAIVKDKYPSEGPQYLEKIIQASFDIPEPRKEDLRDQMHAHVDNICGSPSEGELLRFMNIFYDVVAPEIRTPRDVIRLANSLSVTWPAIGTEVDCADFVGIETFRLLQPTVYRAIRSNKNRLTGGSDNGTSRYAPEQKSDYENVLLGGAAQKDRERLKRALKRLFPRLDSVWGNLIYDSDSVTGWERQRRICAASRFDAYFRLSIGDDILKKDEIDTIVQMAADRLFVQKSLREALGILRHGGTKAALILDELNLHADSVADADVQPLLASIFEIADELDNPRDVAKAFSVGDNRLRIHWLLRRLVLERFDASKRSAILLAACEAAPVGWLVDIADSANAAHNPRDGKTPATEERCITTKDDSERLQVLALNSLRAAAKSGLLARHAKLPYLLYKWRDMAKDDGKEVRRWTKAQLTRESQVVSFAKAFTSHGWSQSVADRVAQRTTMANMTGADKILDVKSFRSRITALLADQTISGEDRSILSEFDGAWTRQDSGERL